MIAQNIKIKNIRGYIKGDNLFVAVLIFFTLILSIILYFDLNRKTDSYGRKENSIGKIIFKKNVVRRKFAEQVVWDEIPQNTLLINNDTVFTGALSDATIVLNDGTVIEVDSESMILIELSKEKTNIELNRGTIQTKRSKSAGKKFSDITIKSADKKIVMKEGELKLAKVGNKSIDFLVRRGKVDVYVQDTIKEFKEGQKVSISKSSVDVKDLDLFLNSPADSKRFFASRNELDIEFSWDIGKGKSNINKEYIFEVSPDKAFSKISTRSSLKETKIKISLAGGTYYWRVSLGDNKKGKINSSEIRKFTIIKEDPLVLLAPGNGARIEYASGLPSIQFVWQKNGMSDSYRLEISSAKDFSKIIRNVDTRSTRLSLQWENSEELNKEKIYYWRVKTSKQLEDWPEQVSPVYDFVIVRKKDIKPPELLSPADGEKISQMLFGQNRVILNWNKSIDIVKTRIYLSKNKDFSRNVEEYVADSNYLVLKKQMPLGNYYWKVKGVGSDGRETPFSEVRTFSSIEKEKLSLEIPEDKAKFNIYEVEKSGIAFKWIQQTYGQYRFELSRDRKFGELAASRVITAGSLNFKPENPGAYFWRIRLLGENNTELNISDVRSLIIENDLADPVPVSPLDGIVIDMSQKDLLDFSWKEVNGANGYEIRLYQIYKRKGKARKRDVASAVTNSLSYRVSELKELDVGEFFWTIKAVRKDRKGRVTASSNEVKNKFTINLSRLSASKIKIVSPSTQVIP